MPMGRPTDAELQILDVLWECGPATVRQIHDALRARRGVGYTTILKLLQIMLVKGLVQREDDARSHVYAAVLKRDKAQRALVGDLIERAFNGSSAGLAMRALSDHPASTAELDEVEALIAALRARERRS